MLGINFLNAAKCFGDSASQKMMIIFHLPPIAAKAAVSGQPVTGLGRARRWLPGGAWLLKGAFLLALITQITFVLKRIVRKSLEVCG
jgi:hypothetical protein